MINLFYDEHDADWEAWIDVEDDPKKGVCLGSGTTKLEALFRAELSLRHEINTIHEMMRNQEASEPPKPEYTIRNLRTQIKIFEDWATLHNIRFAPTVTKEQQDDLNAKIDLLKQNKGSYEH